jgi:hypothetical protein
MSEANRTGLDRPEISDDFIEDGAIGWEAWCEELERRRFDGWSLVLSIMLVRLERMFSRLCKAVTCDLKTVTLPSLADEIVFNLDSPD